MVGALACGPKTVNVIVPVGASPEAITDEIALAAMAVPAVPVEGPEAVRVGLDLATTVSDMPAPQVEAAELLLESPLYDAYHQ